VVFGATGGGPFGAGDLLSRLPWLLPGLGRKTFPPPPVLRLLLLLSLLLPPPVSEDKQKTQLKIHNYKKTTTTKQ